MLVGREAECRLIGRVLEQAKRGASGTLVVRGEPGAGKTALLRYAVERGRDMTLLTARGVEADSELAFAGLSDLFRPILDRLEELPPPQAEALAGALALGPRPPGDGFTVAAATLSMLAGAAETRPVLAAVDDVQWLDAPSCSALLFAASESGELRELGPAARALGVELEILEHAEVPEIVRTDDLRLEFRNPLLRSAVYHAAPAEGRRSAHRALADAIGAGGPRAKERRAWHLAAAASAPDEAVARMVEESAKAARERGGHAAAA